MTEYNDYNINTKKIALLRGQELAVKNQIKMLAQKKALLESVTRFTDQADELGLTKNQWDKFFVNLENESLSFLKANTLLAQTSNSRHYYFKPDFLRINTGDIKNNELSEAGTSVIPESNHTLSDLTISLRGHFLVKRRDPVDNN